MNNDFLNDLTINNNNITEKNITMNIKNNENSNKINNYLLFRKYLEFIKKAYHITLIYMKQV